MYKRTILKNLTTVAKLLFLLNEAIDCAIIDSSIIRIKIERREIAKNGETRCLIYLSSWIEISGWLTTHNSFAGCGLCPIRDGALFPVDCLK